MSTKGSLSLKLSFVMPLAMVAAVATPLALAPAAHGIIHEWYIEELYSDAAGDAQYVQLRNTGWDWEDQFSMATLRSDGTSFDFPGNAPSHETANRALLVGSAAFAALDGAVLPDFTLPDGFLDLSGDTIVFEADGFDIINQFSYGPGDLPTDGLHALHVNDGVVLNAPTNFDGQTGFVPEPTTATLLLTAGALAMLRRTRRVER